MLAEITLVIHHLFRFIGGCLLLCGTLLFLASMLSVKGPDGYVKGLAFILIGGWISGFGA